MQEDNWKQRIGDPQTAVDQPGETGRTPVPHRSGTDHPPPPGARRVELPR